MKQREAAIPGEEEVEIVHLLTNLGMDHKLAKVVSFLAHAGEGKSRDIERGCRLRQPEVSVATKSLRERGWVITEERKRGGKGRPVHFYRLEVPLQKIVDNIEQEKRSQIQVEIEKIERLKRIVANGVGIG